MFGPLNLIDSPLSGGPSTATSAAGGSQLTIDSSMTFKGSNSKGEGIDWTTLALILLVGYMVWKGAGK